METVLSSAASLHGVTVLKTNQHRHLIFWHYNSVSYYLKEEYVKSETYCLWRWHLKNAFNSEKLSIIHFPKPSTHFSCSIFVERKGGEKNRVGPLCQLVVTVPLVNINEFPEESETLWRAVQLISLCSPFVRLNLNLQRIPVMSVFDVFPY
jgi:hypothetical protein